MKTHLLNKTRSIATLLLMALVWDSAEAQVVNPSVRQTALDRAKRMLSPREIVVPATSPFHSDAFNELVGLVDKPVVATAGPAAPRNNRELLQAIASGLKPSGYFVISGAPTLVFGQKRVKAGGLLTINFEGTEYTLEILSVDRTNFTVRLNRDEFTRPIK
ncbi:hypothetical protein [Oleiharenicola lentus]|uniref:hypothetical protein n=1 Tax=Oleiharenicola lentus TaxID=2508720 RepID=UPI003F679A6E